VRRVSAGSVHKRRLNKLNVIYMSTLSTASVCLSVCLFVCLCKLTVSLCTVVSLCVYSCV